MVPSQVPWCVVKTCLKNSDPIWSINLARSVSSEFTYFLCTELVSITCTDLVQCYQVPLPGYVYCGILVPIKVVFLQYPYPCVRVPVVPGTRTPVYWYMHGFMLPVSVWRTFALPRATFLVGGKQYGRDGWRVHESPVITYGLSTYRYT